MKRIVTGQIERKKTLGSYNIDDLRVQLSHTVYEKTLQYITDYGYYNRANRFTARYPLIVISPISNTLKLIYLK